MAVWAGAQRLAADVMGQRGLAPVRLGRDAFGPDFGAQTFEADPKVFAPLGYWHRRPLLGWGMLTMTAPPANALYGGGAVAPRVFSWFVGDKFEVSLSGTDDAYMATVFGPPGDSWMSNMTKAERDKLACLYVMMTFQGDLRWNNTPAHPLEGNPLIFNFRACPGNAATPFGDIARAVFRYANTEACRHPRFVAKVTRDSRKFWRIVSSPDGAFLRWNAVGEWHEEVLAGRAAVLYVDSRARGTCDSPGAIHQILAAGGMLALHRERAARDCDDDGDAAGAALLRAPVLVAGFPADWQLTTAHAEGGDAVARIWAFQWSPGGVQYWRSLQLSIKGAMDFLYAYMY